jgi:hypothetical protein
MVITSRSERSRQACDKAAAWPRSLLGLVMLLSAGSVLAAGIQIKGVTPGSSPDDACGAAKIADVSHGEIASSTPGFKTLNLKECVGSATSFGGNRLKEPSSMLFMDDKMIAMKMIVRSMTMEQLADVVESLREAYGEPVIKHGKGQSTYTWKKDGHELLIERVSPSWDDNRLTVLLRDDAGFKRYMEAHDRNSMAIKRAQKADTKQDVLN